MTNEFFKGFWEWFNEKTTSPWWAVYISVFVTYNWKFFYVSLLDPAENYDLPKVEYLERYILPQMDVFSFVWPTAIAFVVIVFLPRFTNALHDISLDYFFDRKDTFASKEKLREEQERQIIEEVQKLKEERIKSLEKIEQLNKELAAQEKKSLQKTKSTKPKAKFVIYEDENKIAFHFFVGKEKILDTTGANSVPECEDLIAAVQEYIHSNSRISNIEGDDGDFYFTIEKANGTVVGHSVNKKSKIALAKLLTKARNNINDAEIVLKEE